jgi:putative sigma-54 modulation protein
MEVLVRGQHYHVTGEVEERAREKLSRLDHYLPLLRDGTCEVDLLHEKAKEPDRRFVVHVNMSAHGVHLHATGHAESPEAAIDHAAHVLTRQAQRKKDRLYSHNRQRRPDPAPEVVPDEVVVRLPARIKRFAMKPMDVAEAMEQIEALGHDFYVFHHADEDSVAVLYRRHAGGYGLILPELP